MIRRTFAVLFVAAAAVAVPTAAFARDSGWGW